MPMNVSFAAPPSPRGRSPLAPEPQGDWPSLTGIGNATLANMSFAAMSLQQTVQPHGVHYSRKTKWTINIRPTGVMPGKGWIVHRFQIKYEYGEELATDPARIRASGCYAQRIGGDSISRARGEHAIPDPISKAQNMLTEGMGNKWRDMWGAPKGPQKNMWIEYELPSSCTPAKVVVTTSRAVRSVDHVPSQLIMRVAAPCGTEMEVTRTVVGRDGPYDKMCELRIDAAALRKDDDGNHSGGSPLKEVEPQQFWTGRSGPALERASAERVLSAGQTPLTPPNGLLRTKSIVTFN